MRRQKRSVPKPKGSAVEEALGALCAEELRESVRGLLPWLDGRTHARLANDLIERASRNSRNWAPTGPSTKQVERAVAFAEAARLEGFADPARVDRYLREGISAFLSKDYPAAVKIFRAVVIPISEAEIDLGQHELVDEVLGVEVSECAAQYVAAVYMTSDRSERAAAVMAALAEMASARAFWNPLKEIERVSVEALPDFEEFLQEWRLLSENEVASTPRGQWETVADRRLREVVLRIEGVDGLARLARSTRSWENLRAWCSALVEADQWGAALEAYVESARIIDKKSHSTGDFLDGAALAAQELGRVDLPKRLEQAWLAEPTLLRLRRWLGSSGSAVVVRKRAATALGSCPRTARSEQAFLHLLLRDYSYAAELLAKAPGLGWSGSGHPAYLLVRVFCVLLGVDSQEIVRGVAKGSKRAKDYDEMDLYQEERDRPRLPNPTVEDVLALTGPAPKLGVTERSAILRAMRTAAEKRIQRVTEEKHRRYYSHAASLAAAYVAAEDADVSAEWLAAIRKKYRRYSALEREFKRYDQ